MPDGGREGTALFSRWADGPTDGRRSCGSALQLFAVARKRRGNGGWRQVAQKRITNRGERVCVRDRHGTGVGGEGLRSFFSEREFSLSRDVPLAAQAAKGNL